MMPTQFINTKKQYLSQKKANINQSTNKQPEYSLYSVDRLNKQELHDLQKYTACVQQLHPIPGRQYQI